MIQRLKHRRFRFLPLGCSSGRSDDSEDCWTITFEDRLAHYIGYLEGDFSEPDSEILVGMGLEAGGQIASLPPYFRTKNACDLVRCEHTLTKHEAHETSYS